MLKDALKCLLPPVIALAMLFVSLIWMAFCASRDWSAFLAVGGMLPMVSAGSWLMNRVFDW